MSMGLLKFLAAFINFNGTSEGSSARNVREVKFLETFLLRTLEFPAGLLATSSSRILGSLLTKNEKFPEENF